MLKMCAVGVMALVVSGCASLERVTRATTEQNPVIASELALQSSSWNVLDVRVDVPETLSTTEANMYYPTANLIWRGEPLGDRHAQVAALMDDAITQGLAHLSGPQDVYFDISLRRFHSLTEKSRAFTGGVHDMIFVLTVVDANTDVPLFGPAVVETSLKAFGGRRALKAEQEGFTQKVRIQNHLVNLMQSSFPNAA